MILLLTTHFFEFKLSKAPKPSKGLYQLVDDMQPDSAWVVAPVDDIYAIGHDIHVCPLDKLPMLSDDLGADRRG